jgi:phosphate-selective porin OprO/OprP
MTLKNLFRFGSLFTLTLLLPCMTLAQTQDGKGERQSHQTDVTTAGGANTDTGRKAGSGDKVEQLQAKVEQLQALVEQQQRALAEMQKSLEALTSKRAVLTPASAQAPSAGSQTLTPLIAIEAAQTNKGAPSSSTELKGHGPVEKSGGAAGSQKSSAFFSSQNGQFEASITALGQLDFRGYQSGNHPPNTYALRRARLGVHGKFMESYEYKLEGDFGDTRGTLLRDAFVGINHVPWLRFRAGHFREPFSQERLQSASALDFVERSLLLNLMPDRSPGIMVFGAINKGVFEYQLGSFNGRGILATNDEGTPESAVRLRFYPFKRGGPLWTRGLAFGGAYTQGRTRNGLSVAGLTESRSSNFFTPDIVNGKIIRANAETSWVAGPAAFRAEYIQTNEEREGLGAGGTALPGVVGKGYMAQMTYLLTGEDKPENGLPTPKRNLFGDGNGASGFGAWELKARYANLQISDGTPKSNRAETIFFGANWYFNRYMRHMIDFGFERFKDPLRSPNLDDKNFFVILSRIQVAF